MSFQLLYNHKLRQKKHGDKSGILMKSQDMPAWLVNVVLHACRIAGKDDSPLRFLYRIVSVETGIYHILSCAAGCGIHNLILTPTEVTHLRRNANRPTPAGIMLALQTAGFWKPEISTPSLHCEEPRLAASALPEADFQVTWKKITGHKNNARVFLTAPYNKDCLILTPDAWEADTILQLLHESDWLSSLRGWGRTFTTRVQLGDSFEEMERIFLTHDDCDSPFFHELIQRAPLLKLTGTFDLQNEQETEAPVAPTKAPDYAEARTQTSKSAPECHIPYIYLESPDEDMYDINPRSHPLLRWSLYIAALALLGMGVHFMVSETADHAGEVTRKAIEAIAPEDDLLQLRELSKLPYSPDSITRKLDKIYAHLTAAPVTTDSHSNEDILEIVSILKYATTDTSGHALNIRRLRECAHELKIDANALSRLYLNEATHDCSVQDWEKQLTATEIENWQQLLHETPELREILLSQPFEAYTKRLLQEPQETADSPTETTSDEASAAPAPTELPGIACVEGEPLPSALLQAINNAPVQLEHGQWCVIRRYHDSGNRSRHMGNLSAQGQQLRIEKCGKNEYRICPTSPNADISELHLRIADGKLTQIQCEGAPVVLNLPIPGDNNTYTPTILLPRKSIKLHPMGESAPPDEKQLNMDLQEQDIILDAAEGSGLPQMSIVTGKGFPWTRMMSELTLNRGRVIMNLPILRGANKLVDATDSQFRKYCWSYQKLPVAQTINEAFDCQLLRIYDFSDELRHAFHHLANTYCMGSKDDTPSFYSLARLYAITLEPVNETEAHQNADKWNKLLLNPDFRRVLVAILGEHNELAAAIQTSIGREATDIWKNATHRSAIRKAILATLSAQLKQIYADCRRREIQQPTDIQNISLMLQHVQVSNQGELMWEFALRHDADK